MRQAVSGKQINLKTVSHLIRCVNAVGGVNGVGSEEMKGKTDEAVSFDADDPHGLTVCLFHTPTASFIYRCLHHSLHASLNTPYSIHKRT